MSKYVKGEEIKRICGTVITASGVGQANASENVNFYSGITPISDTLNYTTSPNVSRITINGKITEPTIAPSSYVDITFDTTNYCINFKITAS